MQAAFWSAATLVATVWTTPATSIPPPLEISGSIGTQQAGITAYDTPHRTVYSDEIELVEVTLATSHTLISRPVSETEAQTIEDGVHRVIRQRLAHARFCVETTGTTPATEPIQIALHIASDRSVAVRSSTHQDFAQCLSPLAALWPLSDGARGSRTRMTLRVEAGALSAYP
jgi:hypothetical protein